jgi:hypothetical protein
MKKNAGNMLAVFLGVLLLAIIILPLVIQLLQTESKQSVNYQKSTVAFQLAESAVAKGYAKLTESRKNWMDALGSVTVAGYANDREYVDLAGGSYKVKFALGSMPATLRVIGTGRDSSTRETRSIEVEYSGNDPDAPALIFNHGQWGSVWYSVHWGSVKSYNNLDANAEYGFPRLFSSGSVRYRDENPLSPNTDNRSYWAYKTDMGSPPAPDLVYYKQKAMNSVVPSSTTTGEIRRDDGTPVVRSPAGSGYFASALNVNHSVYLDKYPALPEAMGNHYEFRSSTSVLYFESGTHSFYPYILRAFLEVEAVIMLGGYFGITNSAVPYHVFRATIPETAPYQFQGTQVWAVGNPSGQTFWNSTYQAIYAQPNHCCFDIPNLQIHGYLYLDRPNSSRLRVLGVVQQNGDGAWWTHSKVYYDPDVLENVVWATAPLYRRSWKEVSPTW